MVIFAKGRVRILCVALLAVLAGNTIVLLAPTWILGYLVYYVSKRIEISIG